MEQVGDHRPLNLSDSAFDPVRGITVIDVDTHLTEPADLWTSRAPVKYKELVPRIIWQEGNYLEAKGGFSLSKDAEGQKRPFWVVEGDIVLGYAGAGSVINKEGVKQYGAEFILWPLTEASPAASFVEPRLAMMDDVGIWGQILYPNAVGFGGQAMAKIEDPELRLVVLKIWNDAMVEIAEDSGGRIHGMAIIPWWDIDTAIAEVERVHQMDLKGVNLNLDPQNQGLPDLGNEFYQPLWEAIADVGLPVNFHIGASVSQSSYFGTGPWPGLNNDAKLALGSTLLYINNARVIGNLVYSGVLDRNPTLKVVSVESGIGWIPFILESLDYQAVENNVDYLSMKPSEYFERQIYSCFWFEAGPDLMKDVDRVGVDKCMFETDFPHPTCLYPNPLLGIAQSFEDNEVPYDARKKLLGENAARVYNIELPVG